jgi:hypothetical protein
MLLINTSGDSPKSGIPARPESRDFIYTEDETKGVVIEKFRYDTNFSSFISLLTANSNGTTKLLSEVC